MSDIAGLKAWSQEQNIYNMFDQIAKYARDQGAVEIIDLLELDVNEMVKALELKMIPEKKFRRAMEHLREAVKDPLPEGVSPFPFMEAPPPPRSNTTKSAMTITVKSPKNVGGIEDVEVECGTTAVRQLVAKMSALRPEQARMKKLMIYYNGDRLAEDKTLEAVGIKHGAAVTCLGLPYPVNHQPHDELPEMYGGIGPGAACLSPIDGSGLDGGLGDAIGVCIQDGKGLGKGMGDDVGGGCGNFASPASAAAGRPRVVPDRGGIIKVRDTVDRSVFEVEVQPGATTEDLRRAIGEARPEIHSLELRRLACAGRMLRPNAPVTDHKGLLAGVDMAHLMSVPKP